MHEAGKRSYWLGGGLETTPGVLMLVGIVEESVLTSPGWNTHRNASGACGEEGSELFVLWLQTV